MKVPTFLFSLFAVYTALVGSAKPILAQEADAWVNCEGFEGIKAPDNLLAVWRTPPKAGESSIAVLQCKEKLKVLGAGSESGWWRVQVKGKEGVAYYAVLSFFENGGPIYVAKALGYQVLPYQQTTNLRFGSYGADTNCFGSGQFILSNSWTSNLNCSTTYEVPTDIPLTWGWTDVYNYVETSQGRYLIACRANWRFSKCSYLIPGSVTQMRLRGSDVEIAAMRGDKMTVVKYDLLQYEPQMPNQPVPPATQLTPSPVKPTPEPTPALTAPVPPQGEPTTVLIKSSPEGAEITIDGKFVGSTPSTMQLAPGDHEIVIEKKGGSVRRIGGGEVTVPTYRAWRRTLTVNPGSTLTVDAALEQVQ